MRKIAIIIGLTGGIASGKSTVSNMFKERGFSIVDADIAARVVVEPGKDAYKQIVQYFGEDILLQDGQINRSKLGRIIFHNEEKRQKLNSIVHPAVRKQMEEWKEEALQKGKNTIIYDIPLLYESNLVHLVEKTIVVYVKPHVQLSRLMARNQLSKEEANARIQSQIPLDEKVKLADAVIDNNGSRDDTEKQVEEIIQSWQLQP